MKTTSNSYKKTNHVIHEYDWDIHQSK